MDGQLTVAVIGSFRQHNAAVQETCEILRMAGVLVTSPVGVEIIERGIPFVRFTSDDSNWSDPAVQALALHRILRASLTYVVAPGGYVGRTTCYEIGRVLQARKPIYFSERPTDLPILVSDEFILGARTLARLVTCPGWEPTLLHESGQELCCQLERELLNGEFRQD